MSKASGEATAAGDVADTCSSSFSRFSSCATKKIHQTLVEQHQQDLAYIAELERILNERSIEIPTSERNRIYTKDRTNTDRLMVDGSLESLSKVVHRVKPHAHQYDIKVQFRNLSFWNEMPKKTIPTVGSSFRQLIFGSGKKERRDIIKDLTGKILPGRMTLVMGPPGCGKTTFLKALAGQLTVGSAHLEGDILYNGDSINSGKYLVGKVATYADEKEQHAGTLTVKETMEFAWQMTTGGHHSYAIAKDEASAAILDQGDHSLMLVHNVLKVLGLHESSNTLVGDGMIRGVSGGQKRRVTLGEMLVLPRRIKFLDAISNGLDAATTFDIIQALKFITNTAGMTTVISLLQPAPDVFYSFTDVIVMAEGQIIYHGATTKVLEYFTNLGYHCPEIMDVADFLQELPTPDGRRFAAGNRAVNGDAPPLGIDALVKVWKESEFFSLMNGDMEVDVSRKVEKWPAVYSERYPGSFWFIFSHLLQREYKLLSRNTSFLAGRIMSNVLVGAIAGSLFSDLATENFNSMSGILFFSALYGALSSMSMLPIIFAQRAVFYKHSKSLFYPTYIYVLAQTLVMCPLMMLETLLFSTIVYWSVGLSEDHDGSRFFTFMFVVFIFASCMSQFFRLTASCLPTAITAQPIAGVFLVLMVLFSGFIIPKSNIPPGWEWFYWLNPVAYVLKGVTVNEFLAPDYDNQVCVSALCAQTKRFGDVVLESRGNPTDQEWVWYSVAVMVGMYLTLLVITTLCLTFIRIEAVPPAPIEVDFDEDNDSGATAIDTTTAGTTVTTTANRGNSIVEIPFEPVAFAFKDIWYTIKLPSGEELDLLKEVSGFFEPGTVTALMGSSGAGKTTLLDVLSGRKNTGEIKGDIFINGKPLNKKQFQRTMGYVEQFDTLSPNDTAREAIEFSAALRLPPTTPADIRAAWVNSVLSLLELQPLENTLVGSPASGGMSFEQKKRVSIGVELVANPAILFLDEPTSGLDSRSAQVVIRCIKRVAASGRSIVCTIHQPSAVIFDAFESLLLLKRGGQTVYFGELGDKSINLVNYFESLPGVAPKGVGVNPATWMLEAIGAGTGSSIVKTDFHAAYTQSSMCSVNTAHIEALCSSHEDPEEHTPASHDLETGIHLTHLTVRQSSTAAIKYEPQETKYNVGYSVQFKMLLRRSVLSYWRSPSYNFGRMLIGILVSLIFSSAYVDQSYSSDVDVISRVALMFVTVMFMGVIVMNTVQPVIFAERPAFYREQYSNLYSVKLYTVANTLVEIPYLIFSSIMFLLPYFFIVGFDKGDTTVKFFWYWLFMGLHMTTMVFMGHFLASALPNEETSAVLGGMCTTFISLFCGFMIQPQNFPDFWIFMYWLSPMHYTLEGLISTQFHGDDTLISITGTPVVTTTEKFITSFYSEWRYGSRGYDIMALCLFIIALRLGTYLALQYVRHDKR